MAPLLLKCNNLILFAERGVLTWVRVVGGLRGGRLDAREPPLRLVPVCGISYVRTSPDKFGDRHWMAKNVRTVRPGHLVAIW